MTTSTSLPGLQRGIGPHEKYLTFGVPGDLVPPKEANTLIFALIIEAQARLVQLDGGFNYLGYRDDYVPPWRFQFLLERARYFAEHAKNAQREYLNFLGNAEQEEFQELSAAQNVVLEKSNVRIETARVDQARLETEVAKLGQELARLTATNAQRRFDRYQDFDECADDLGDKVIEGAFLREAEGALSGAATGAAVGGTVGTLFAPGAGTAIGAAIGGALGGIAGFFSSSSREQAQAAELAIAAKQREFEKFNLSLGVLEADLATDVATFQQGVAQAGLLVAGMQRAAALLRHEFAVQNLNYLRNRTLNAELWYRLSSMIRSVSDTYMRYAVELAFLAEQAYEFEADKRINVIRFDYDVSEIGNLLAADFLLRDLDTIEQDLIVNQRQRQQQVRYVLSLAREFPEALQDLRDDGSTIFSLRLEQIERRFPGLFNVRIGAVDVTPVALMDPTRFSLEMTYLGSSQVRLKALPDTPSGVDSQSPLNTNDLPAANGEWLAEFQQEWPTKIRITGPETNIYSGLTRQDASATFPFASTSQRGAFEGLGAAAAWRIDLSMKENQLVPGTLADILITFTASGYYDPELRAAIDRAARQATTLTQLLSARQRFPDAFYAFNQSGRMVWRVTEAMLSLAAPVRNLRNLGVILVPAPMQPQFNRLMSRYVVEIDISANGQFSILTPIPEISLAINLLNVSVSVSGADSANAFWDFGEGEGFQNMSQHTYRRPGQYEISLRLVQGGRLLEYNLQLSVSRTQTLPAPLTAFPSFAPLPTGQPGFLTTTTMQPGESADVIWRVDQDIAIRASGISANLPPGKHVVAFTAVRKLRAHIYSRQRFVPDQVLDLDGFRISTNRVFELDGSETTGAGQNAPPNALTDHLFPLSSTNNMRLALSPADIWSLELSLNDNPFLGSVTANDTVQVNLGEIGDAILLLEYETGPG